MLATEAGSPSLTTYRQLAAAQQSAKNPSYPQRDPLARGNMNGASKPFGSPSTSSQNGRYGSGPTRSELNGVQQSLHNSSAMTTTVSSAPMEYLPAEGNIMNRKAPPNSSLYQICINLRRRLAEVPGFQDHIAEMEEEELETNDPTDPVTLMWNCLRRGYPLMTIYNALMPPVPLEVDASRTIEAKIGKTATFKFLQACMSDLKFPPNDCFLITDLYGEDTTGFVKVTKIVNRVLDILYKKGLLLHKEPSRTAASNSMPQTPTMRQHIIDELVRTERDYVQHLEYLQLFKNNVEQSGAIAGDAVHDVFLNLNALLDFQRRFLIRVEQQNSLPESEQNWGKLFSWYKDSFRVYEPFLANTTRCNTAVMKEWEKLKIAAIAPEVQGIVETPSVLLGFLIKPFQRLSKYPLLLEDLEKKGGYDDLRRKDLLEGHAAAKSILDRAEEAVAKEHRLAAVNELSSRVEDWKGHKIDHFGDLLLFGNYTVLKGEGVKEVEREVSIIFDSLDPRTRGKVLALVKHTQRVSSRTPRRVYTGLQAVPEEVEDGQNFPTLAQTPSKRSLRGFLGIKKKSSASPFTPNSPSTPNTSSEKALQILGCTPGSEPVTPSRSGSSPHSRVWAKRVKGSLTSPSWSPFVRNTPALPMGLTYEQELLLETIKSYRHLCLFNGVFKQGHPLLFSFTPLPPPLASLTTPMTEAKARNPIKLENEWADDMALKRPVRVQYKVYLFERILLCCKEINPNKPKNKMLGNKQGILDKKGKLKLQLKGRIFMQNVTDVLTLKRDEKSSYTIQIFWKGDPGVENFVIRFTSEVEMNKWRDTVYMQKKVLSESARNSGQTGTSTTEFTSLKNQPKFENPYQEEEDGDEDDTRSNHTVGPGKSAFNMSRNASSTSLRSTGQPRMPPPRFPLPDNGNGVFAPLSLNTNIPPGTGSPGEFPGNSYFSPTNDSPMSTRSSQASLQPFSRQQIAGGGWSYDENKHRTAPAIGRAPSREGPGPPNSYYHNGRTVTRPSLPVMATTQNPQQQLIAQSRLRSASTPDIHNPNAPGARRPSNGQLQAPAENVPVPPIPAHMVQDQALINRSQTASPIDSQLPIRSATQSPSVQRDWAHRQYQEALGYDRQGQRLPQQNENELLNYKQGTYAEKSFQPTKSPTSPDSGIPYPAQLKVKICFEPAPSHVTIVVPIIIKHKSLIDRIDSKMAKVTMASISNDTARLRYKDSEGDMVTIRSDEDVHLAIEDWGTENLDQLHDGIPPDFELYWLEN